MISLRGLRKVVWTLLSETITEWNQDKVSNLAAALAYYTIFSAAPLLVIVIAVAGSFYGQAEVQSTIVLKLRELMGEEGAGVIKTTLDNIQSSSAGGSVTASLISVADLFIGATGVFAQLQDSLNTIWDVKPVRFTGFLALVRSRLLSFIMVVGTGFFLLASLILSATLSTIKVFAKDRLIDIDLIWQLLDLVLSYGVTTFLFAMIYKFLPNARIYWRDVWVGAVVTTLLFSAGKSLLSFYLSHSSFSSTYGAAGSLVILVAWVYYSAQILFIGAEFTQVYARRYGSKIQSPKHHRAR